jgi:hypothetical protein
MLKAASRPAGVPELVKRVGGFVKSLTSAVKDL